MSLALQGGDKLGFQASPDRNLAAQELLHPATTQSPQHVPAKVLRRDD